VVVQADDCCSHPVATDSRALGDPCLVPYDDAFKIATLGACPDAERCLAMNCAYFSPPSRVVTRDGTGTCVFTDECDAAANACAIAIDYNECCACAQVLPKAVVETDPCVVTSDEAVPPGCADCAAVNCRACPVDPPVGSCVPRGELALRTCTTVAVP
jgi:hypothetical protein